MQKIEKSTVKKWQPLLLFVWLVVSACKTIAPAEPQLQPTLAPPIEQEPSTILLPVDVDLTPYYALADKQVPMKFDGGEHPCEGVAFDYHFVRDPMKLAAVNNEVTIDVSGKYWIKMSYCPNCSDLVTAKPICVTPRIPFSCGIDEPMRKIEIQYQSVVQLTPNYGLRTSTSLTNVNPIDPCKVTVFQYDATDQLVTEIRKSLTSLAKDIDKQTSGITFKKEAATAWKQASETFPIPGYGYIHFNPISIGMVQPKIYNNHVYSTLAVTAKPVFNHTATTEKSKPLPTLQFIAPPKTDTFEVVVDFNLNYDSLTKTIQQFIGGQKLKIKNKEVVFDSIAISGAATHELIFKIQFSGAKKGVLYLRATPQFNEQTQTIEFTHSQFDVATKSVLLKTAKWLFNDKILLELENSSKQDLSPQLNKLLTELNQSLQFSMEGFQLSGKMNSLKVNAIFPTGTELIVRATATGKLQLKSITN